MAPASDSPKVVGVVDEAGNTVSVGVVHGKAFLPVASAALDHAKARGLDAKGVPVAGNDGEEEGE